MFIIEMIYLSIVCNIGLIAFTLITLTTIAIAIWGEKGMEALIAKNPELWDKEIDWLNPKAIWNLFKK